MAHPAIQRFVALSIWTLGLLYSGARLMLDVIGYTTAPDDFAQLQERMPNWLEWIFSTPWPVPATLMVVLTGFVIYVCWPRRGPSYADDRQADPMPVAPEASQTGGDSAHWWHRIIRGTVSSGPPPFDERGLYVGSMKVSTGKLKAERWVEISVTFFNATGHTVFIHRPEGSIKVGESLGGSGTTVGVLPPPLLVHDKQNEWIPDRTESHFRLEQSIPKEFADRILAVDNDYSVSFDLEDLSIIVCSHDNPSVRARLPVWDGITLRRSPDMIFSGQNKIMRVRPASIKISS